MKFSNRYDPQPQDDADSLFINAPKSVTIEKNIPTTNVYRPTSHWGVVAKAMVKGDSVLTPSVADARRLQIALINRYKRAKHGRIHRRASEPKRPPAKTVTRRREWRDKNRKGYRVWLLTDIPQQPPEEEIG
jgi:hypothetical protein